MNQPSLVPISGPNVANRPPTLGNIEGDKKVTRDCMECDDGMGQDDAEMGRGKRVPAL